MDQQTEILYIKGMTCTSCEVIIERKLKKIDGVTAVEVAHATGRCTIVTDPGTRLAKDVVKQAIADTEYELVGGQHDIERSFSWKHLLQIGLTLIVVYVIVSALGLFSFDATVDASLSYPAIFTIGLIASVSSCIAVVGGLVLTFTATVKRTNPNTSKWQLLRAHLFFNSGRLLSYFLLGGLVAVLGSALAPSPRVMGLIALVAALVMIVLALDLLGLSGSKKWIPRMPKAWSHWIHDMAERQEWWIPFLLGGLTFFLPCGFTQSMQLYALTTGSFLQGALTLFIFALGTLPALLGIGALASIVSSRSKGYRWFMLIAGCLVLLLGLYNVKNSLTLLGVNTAGWFTQSVSSEGVATRVNGQVQEVYMAVNGIDYVPNSMTVQKDVSVRWIIDGSKATGCTSVIAIPALGISQPLSRTGDTIIEFTPTQAGRLSFTCGMGMAYGEFQVVSASPLAPEACDSATQTCSNAL